MMRIGMFGGSFNPIHVGHLILAESATSDLKLDRMYFITSYISPHKKIGEMLDFDDRCRLVEAAIQDNPYFFHSAVEKQIGGTSYSLKTIEHFLNLHVGAKLYFFIGLDQISVFDEWYEYKKILELCTVIGVTRAKNCLVEAKDKIAQIERETGHKIGLLNIPDIEISSTDLRKRIRRGRSIKYRVPMRVCDIIEERQYYI